MLQWDVAIQADHSIANPGPPRDCRILPVCIQMLFIIICKPCFRFSHRLWLGLLLRVDLHCPTDHGSSGLRTWAIHVKPN